MSMQHRLPDQVVPTDAWTLFCAECSQKMRILTAFPAQRGRETLTYECACGHSERIDVALHSRTPRGSQEPGQSRARKRLSELLVIDSAGQFGLDHTTRAVLTAGGPEQAIDRLRHGEVLVVPCTTPAYNAVLVLAGAIVTADGGPLSHAAVLARELGISAVVGARGAMTDIPDGALIDVDPVLGEVRIVAEV